MNTPLSKIQIKTIETEVGAASAKWKAGFNGANPQICAEMYHKTAVMEVAGIGVFTGHAEIYSFWKDFISSGAKDVEYFNTTIRIVDENTAVLASDWKMNVGKGIITKEKWCRQDSGEWLLTEDAFEMTEKFN